MGTPRTSRADAPDQAEEPRLDPSVHTIGGQALVEGVMMRGGDSWAGAVRRDDGTIATTRHSIPPREGMRRLPLVRGVVALVESVQLGIGALVWAANERITDPDEKLGRGGVAASVALAAVGAVVVFGAGPAVVAKLMGVRGSVAFSAVEGLVRLALLFGYLLLLGRSAEIRRTFAYHGAEHMTVHAHEHGRPLVVEEIRRFPRQHPRCGTSFLVVTVLVTIVAFSFVGHRSWPVLVATRVLGLPLLAGAAYEVIRFAGAHRHSWYGKVLSAPGTLVQAITTLPPDDEQIAVAVAALERLTATEPATEPAAAPSLDIAPTILP